MVALCAFMFSCGPDQDLVNSGVIHSCKIKELEKQLEEDPTNEELQSELKSTEGFLESVINSAKEGGRAELEEAIEQGAENCE